MNQFLSKLHAMRTGMKTAGAMLLSLFCLAAIFMLTSMFPRPPLFGDAVEYMLMQQSLDAHGSPHLTEKDAIEAERALNFNGLLAATKGDGTYGYFTSPNDGKTYSYHFWGYALMSMPFKSALKRLGMNDANAYLALNAFLFFLAQILIWLFWDDDLWGKVSLMAATAFSPISLYLVLPSPEAMSALCLMMALVAYSRGKFVLAGVASILGSWQNPPIAFFSFVCGLRWLHGCAGNFKARNARQNALAVLQGAPFALVFVPCIFWLLKFNCLNLISHLGGASFSFISATRVWDLWMDLNQGLIVFPTAMTLLFFACAIVAFIQRKWAGFELPALALALTVGATSTGNWTSVGDIVTRYAVWIMPIALAYPLMAFKGKTLKCAYVFSVAVSAVQTGFFFPGTDANDFFREPAKFAMNHAPSLYRPAPETFCSRGNFVVGDRFQGFNAYVDDNGCIRKAWTSRSALEHAKAHVKVVDSNAFEAVLKVLPDDPHKHVFVDFPADVARKRLPAR